VEHFLDVIIADNELSIRLAFFVGLFVILAILETYFPRRRLKVSRLQRWSNNLGLSVLNSVLMKLIFPVAGTGLAVIAIEEQFGLLNQLDIPAVVAVLIYIVAFDLTIYFQHRFFHFLGPLWRLHRMHHTDLDYDLTTGNRFHPLSIVFSLLIKLVLVILMGPPIIAVLVSEILLNLTSMFNHSNVNVPPSVDRVLRWFVVTPDMHRVHHSQDQLEYNKNFGFNFPWWDRLFGTYQEQPAMGHESMLIGIQGFTSESSVWLHRMLAQPFTGPDERGSESQ
jgi:sterol desaturase/sphingolipid hydroxylase (fatty acid hydroxylase superfamily)